MSKGGFHSKRYSEERKGNKSVTNATAPWVEISFLCPSFLAPLLGRVFNLKSEPGSIRVPLHLNFLSASSKLNSTNSWTTASWMFMITQSSGAGLSVCLCALAHLLCLNSDPYGHLVVCDGLGFSTPYHLRAVNHWGCRLLSRRCTLLWGVLRS